MKKININYLLLLLLASMLFSPELMAAGAGGMPWEAPLTTIVTSVTGPVAFTISILGLVAAGAMLVFGGEISHFLKSIVTLILVISLLVFATGILTNLFGVGAALIA